MEQSFTSRKKEVVEREDEREILNQFYITLYTTLLQLRNNNPDIDKVISEHVEAKLKEPQSWAGAYEIEQLMIELYDETTLDLILQRRMLEIENQLDAQHTAFYRTQVEKVKTRAEKEALLEQLIDDLQWKYTIREMKLKYARTTRKQASSILTISIVLFLFLVFANIFLSYDAGLQEIVRILAVAIAGFMGASFSSLTSFKDLENRSFNDLKMMHRLSYVLSRSLIGVGAAVIIYYFIASGILLGAIFPNNVDNMQAQDFYKLIVWGFIAGFSEKLIPDLISQQTDKASKPKDNKTT